MMEIRTFAGHSRPLVALRPSPDGACFVSRSLDDTACLWETGTGRQVAAFRAAEALAFTPDGTRLLQGGADGLLSLLDVGAPDRRRSLGSHAGPIRSVAVSLDGKQVLSGGEDGTLRLWDLASGLELYREDFHSPVTGVDFSPGGEVALCCLDACLVVECDLREGRIRCRIETSEQDAITGVSYSPGGGFAIYAFHGDQVIDLRTRKEIDPAWGGSGTVCFSSDDRLLARVQARGIVEIWDTRLRQRLRRIETGAAQVYCVAFSPDDARLLCGTERCLHLFDARTESEVDRSPDLPSPSRCAAFLPGGAGLLTGHGKLALDDTGGRGRRQDGEYVYHDTAARLWSW